MGALDHHSELEFKFAAGHVDVDAFRVWAMELNPIGYKSRAYPDSYYRNGDAVVRHRQWPAPAGELTVKRRKSTTSIEDREEINLRFDGQTSCIDVTTFLHATGWVHEFTLLKHFSHVFWFTHGGAKLAVSLYEVERAETKDTRRFLEVEVERESDVSEETARKLLRLWSGAAAGNFNLDEPLKESLYEIYSGRRYASIA
jgi:hypothetical protein